MPPPARQSFLDLNRLPLLLSLGGYSVELVYWGLIEPSPWRNYLHVHSFFEVCHAFTGRGSFRIRDEENEVRSGQVFVARPREPHEILSSPDDHLGIYFWAYRLSPNEHLSTSGTDALLTSFGSARRAVAPAPESLESVLRLLTEEIARRESGYQEAVEGMARKLVLDAARALVDRPVPSEPLPAGVQDPSHAVVAQIAAYLRDNCGRPVLVRDVAAQVHLSERHAARLFRTVTGGSIGEYLTTLRMERASKLLLSGGVSIKEVARAVGYADTRHFITRFRHHFGQPPATFRRRHSIRQR